MPTYLSSALMVFVLFPYRMVALYALVSCLMTATYATAIEHPRRQRSHGILDVTVTPMDIDFYPGDTITISCQAKAGVRVDDVPFISFYVSVCYSATISVLLGFFRKVLVNVSKTSAEYSN